MLPYSDVIVRNPIFLSAYSVLLVVFVTWIPFMCSSVLVAIFRPKKLPPFKKAVYGYASIWWKFMVSVLLISAEVYILKNWEGSVNGILAISIVCLPLSLMWVNRGYVMQHSWVFLGMTLVVVSIPVSFILYQSIELRWMLVPFGIGVAAGLLLYRLFRDSIKEAIKRYPKLTGLSLLSMILLYPTLWIMSWVNYSIPSWQWPWWYQNLALAGVVLVCLSFVPLIMMEFLKLR